MALTDYVTLGRSGPPTEAAGILGRYLARGGNFIDIANVYTKGHSEAIIGETQAQLLPSLTPRHDVIVIPCGWSVRVH